MDASIRDVANEAHVSTATVSRTYAAPNRVSPATREKVFAAAKKLNYSISRSASALKSGKANRISFLTGGEIYAWFDSQIIAGLNPILRKAGYDLVSYEVHNAEERREFFTDTSIKRNADAVFVNSFQVLPQEAERLRTSGIPIIGINTQPMDEFTITFTVDEREGMWIAVKHLEMLGHRDIAYVCFNPDNEQFKWNGRDRLQAFREVCGVIDPGIRPQVIFAEKGEHRAEDAVSQLLHAIPRISAVCCVTDEYAIPLLYSLMRSGIKVPDDLSVVGFDDSRYAAEIGLTTVHQNPFQTGEAVANTTLDILNGESLATNVQTQHLFLALRNTTSTFHPYTAN